MPVASTDLIAYCSANMPEDNVSSTGGAIAPTVKAIFTDISAADTVEVVSDAVGDTTQTITITGRDSSGVIVTDGPLNLNGTTPVNGTTTFARILKIVINATHAGTVTVRKASDNVTIATLEGTNTLGTAVLSVRRLFYDSAADASGGANRDFYEKIFIKNNHATLAVTNGVVIEQADPTTNITFALASGLNDTSSQTGRLNLIPEGITSGSFNGSNKSIPSGGNLGPGSGIGVWLKLSLAAGASPTGSTYTVRLTGQST